MIDERALLPALNAGDLVLGRMMGAYTQASATRFNSFPVAKLIAINEAPIRSVV